MTFSTMSVSTMVGALFSVAIGWWGSACWSQDIPQPPRCGPYSIQSVTADGSALSLAVATPTLFENGKKIPADTRLELQVFRSTDSGQTYPHPLKILSGGSVLAKADQPQRLDAQVALPSDLPTGQLVLLAVSIKAAGQSSRQVHEFLTFRQTDQLERYRTPTRGIASVASSDRSTSSHSRYKFSDQQREMISRYGIPDCFEIAYLPFVDADGKRVFKDRMERWTYLHNRTEFGFIEGRCTHVRELEGLPQVETDPLYDPGDFSENVKLEEVRRLAVDGILKKVEKEKLKLKSKVWENLETYMAPGLAITFENNELLYVRSLPHWASKKALDSRQASLIPSRTPAPESSGRQSISLWTSLAEPGLAMAAGRLRPGSLFGMVSAHGFSGALPSGSTPLSPAPFNHPPLNHMAWGVRARHRPVAFTTAVVGLFAAGSLCYSLYGNYSDISNVKQGVEATVGFYQKTNEIIDAEKERFNAALQSGVLSPAEHQRMTVQLAQTTEFLTDARNDLVANQALLTTYNTAFGLTGICSTVLSGGSIRGDIVKPTTDFFVTTIAGDGFTYFGSHLPPVLEDWEIKSAFENADKLSDENYRSKYNEVWIKYHVKRSWTLWDNEVGKNDMTPDQRLEQFYALVDQLKQDGWHVAQGVESLAIETIRNSTVPPEDVPQPREKDKVEGIVATGKATEQSLEELSNLILILAKAFVFFDDQPQPVRVDLRAGEVTLTISPDGVASVSPGRLQVSIHYSDGNVVKSDSTLGFINASGDALEMIGEPREGERIPVKSVTGVGKVGGRTNTNWTQPTRWKARYVGYDMWEMKVSVKKPGDLPAGGLPEEISLTYQFEEKKN